MESELIDWLRDRLPEHPCLRLGIGDDAAILTGRVDSTPGPVFSPPAVRRGAASTSGLLSTLVVTTDLLSDGIDFRLGEVDPRRIGHKALAVNLSDLAAMAARPLGVVMAIALPKTIPQFDDRQFANHDPQSALSLAAALYEGMLSLAEQFDVPIAGGDTNTHDGPLVLCGTAFGQVTERGPLTRSGGRPGDRLLVTGKQGGSILGHHLDFTPRLREALLLNERYELHAGIDISDGLALDASRLAAASGCGAVIDVLRVPISDAAKTLADPLNHALSDGEDFELLIAVPGAVAERILCEQPLECGLTDIGELSGQPGVRQRNAEGTVSPLPATGWVHTTYAD